MNYERKYFDPAKRGGTPVESDPKTIAFGWTAGSGADVYLFSELATLAVNVALATRRPLLVTGEPGSGKTRLAAAAAEVLDWQYYPRTVTSRTQATDLLWSFDALRRLNDATTPGRPLLAEQLYVQPGPVWWGFDPATAEQRGSQPLERADDQVTNPAPARKGSGAVVLVDEIDKADPDVPNDLLEPFDVRRFTVKETNDTVNAQRDVFLVLTTNGERELPPAFVRRCVVLPLGEPDKDWFVRVAKEHFPKGDVALHGRVAAEVQRLRDATKQGVRKPSTAEFLDALRVCAELKTDTTAPEWAEVVNTVLVKSDQAAASRARSAPGGAPVV